MQEKLPQLGEFLSGNIFLVNQIDFDPKYFFLISGGKRF